jgi:hypothetical protein
MTHITFKLIINSIGILLNIIGAYLVFVNSPLKFSVIDARGPAIGWDAHDKKIKHENNMVKIGVYTLIAGSIMQLISNFIAE